MPHNYAVSHTEIVPVVVLFTLLLEVWRRALRSDEVQAHASTRFPLRGAAVGRLARETRGQLTLAALEPKPKPIWTDLSFLAHFHDPYMDLHGGQLFRSVQILHLGLQKLAATELEGAGTKEAVARVLDLFTRAKELFRKYQRTSADVEVYDEEADINGVLPYLKVLRPRAKASSARAATCATA